MDYASAVFSVVENPGSTIATVTVSGVQPASCFAAGTRIKTLAGEVPVEDLAPGDVVHARFAGTAPIVWIGHRQVDCRHHHAPIGGLASPGQRACFRAQDAAPRSAALAGSLGVCR